MVESLNGDDVCNVDAGDRKPCKPQRRDDCCGERGDYYRPKKCSHIDASSWTLFKTDTCLGAFDFSKNYVTDPVTGKVTERFYYGSNTCEGLFTESDIPIGQCDSSLSTRYSCFSDEEMQYHSDNVHEKLTL